MEFILNDKTIQTDNPGGMTLLDFIRYEKRLTGTKIGCREGDCGACTVLIGEWAGNQMKYRSMTSCITPLINAASRHVVTIEGLNMSELSPIQKTIIEAGGTQCGFCTVGFIVSLSGYCMDGKSATQERGVDAIDGNICRCTGYKSIERAIAKLAGQLIGKDTDNPIDWLVNNKFIPAYFLTIPQRIAAMGKFKRNAYSPKTRERVGGGTDVYVQKPEHLIKQNVEGFFHRIDIKGIGISANGKHITVGAGSTVTDLMESPVFISQFPNLRKFLKLISSTPIRNMGTLAGNFVNASPIGDLTIFFLALNSSITLKNSNGEARTILLKDFYKGYKTIDKYPDEHLESVQFEVLDANTHFNFEKVSKRTHLDIASSNSALRIQVRNEIIESIHCSAGGVGPIPLYLEKTGQFLKGKQLSPETVSKAVEIMMGEISPISDARGTKEYKTLLLRQLFFAHFIELYPEKFEMDRLA